MAAEQELVCPIGQDARKDIAYVVPCHHQFCLCCTPWWGKQKKNCPLCRRKTEVVKVAAWDDDEDLNFVIRPPAPPIPACFQEAAGLNFSSSSPSSSPSLSPLPFSDEEEDEEAFEEADEEEDEEAEEDPLVGGLQPEAWAQLYRQHHQILDPVLPWLRQELRAIFDTDSCPAAAAESFIFAALCDLGPNGEIEQMQPVLEDKTEMFIQGLMDTIVYQRREEAHRLLGLQGTHVSGGRRRVLQPEAGGQPCGCPWPQSSTQATLTSRPGLFGSAWSPSREEQPSTPGADIRVGPSHAPAAHTVREAEGPHEEMMEQAAAGPSAQGSSPSAPSHLPERAQWPPKRSVDSNQDAQPPCKRPPHLLD